MSGLDVWVVYDRPRDFPSSVVARRWVIDAGQERATGDVIIGPTLEWVREVLKGMDLVCVPRSVADESQIVESWL